MTHAIGVVFELEGGDSMKGYLAVLAAGIVGLSVLPARGSEFSVLDGDYANPDNWTPVGVPGSAGQETNNAHIASAGPSATATYATNATFATSGRLVVGLGAGADVLNMTGNAGTLAFGGNDLDRANYVGVDGGRGTLNLLAGTLLTATNGYLRVGSNGNAATGIVNVAVGGALHARSWLALGSRSVGGYQRGTLNIRGGTVVVGGQLRLGWLSASATGVVDLAGGSLTVSNMTYMNFGGGSGRLKVRGDSQVRFQDLVLQGSDVKSGLQAPTGAGTIHAVVTNGLFAPITCRNLFLNAGPNANWNVWWPNSVGGSHLVVDVAGAEPPLGAAWDLIAYSGALRGAMFDVGTLFDDGAGRHFSVDYGSGANSRVRLTRVEPLADGDVLAVDFSSAGGSAATYNVFTAVGTLGPGAVVKYGSGVPAGDVTLTLAAAGGVGFNNDGAANLWPGTAADPYYVNEADDIVYAGTSITLTARGLDDAFLYTVRVCSLIGNNGTAEERFTVTDGAVLRSVTQTRGARWGAASLAASGMVFEGVATDGAGSLVLTVSRVNSNVFLNAVTIEAHAPVVRTGTLLLVR